MSNIEKKKNELEWYDNPNIITNLLILMIALIVILSQSFAVNNGLGVLDILSSILNHNIGYLLVCIYFVALKTKVGKQYFDFFNIFLIVLYSLTSITSLLTVLQSFGLGSLLGFGIDLMILIYMIHTFLRSTRIWKSMSLNKSPFNEISNGGYFYSILVLSITLLAVNLISTTSFDGTILTLMDAGYSILFIRYIYLYGEFLNSKKISIKNDGNFDQITEKVKEEVTGFIEDNKLDEKYETVKEKVNDFVEDLEEKVVDIKEEVVEKIEEAKLDEKFDAAKKKAVEVANDIKEKAIDIKENVEKKIDEANIDEKFDKAKGQVSNFINDVGEDVKSFVKDAKIEEKIDNAKKKVNDFVDEQKLDEKFEKAKVAVGEFAKEASDDVKKFVEEAKLEEKFDKAKREVSKFVDDVKTDVKGLAPEKKQTKAIKPEEKKKYFSRKKKVNKDSKADSKKVNK